MESGKREAVLLKLLKNYPGLTLTRLEEMYRRETDDFDLIDSCLIALEVKGWVFTRMGGDGNLHWYLVETELLTENGGKDFSMRDEYDYQEK